MSIRIKHSNGTYYAGAFGIGPRFGADKESAATFPDVVAAVREMAGHWAFGDCEIEDDDPMGIEEEPSE